MKYYLPEISSSPKRIWLFFIAVIFSVSSLFAGDITFSMKYRIELATENWEQPIATEITNLENFPVEGASLNFTIRDKLSLDIAYQYSTVINTVQPRSSVLITAPVPWIPKVGIYNVRYELNSSNDINPANDTLSYDIEVRPNPGFSLKLNQLNFINPFQQENSNTGRVDFTIPPGDTVLYINMMFALPGVSSEPQWLVQNFPAPAFADTQVISYWIDLEKIGVNTGMELSYLRYDFLIDSIPVLAPFSSTGMFYSDVYKDYYNVGGDNPVEPETHLFYDLPEINWGGEFKLKTWNYRGCNVPNIDLDSSVYNPRDMVGEVGDWNSCGPASAVNSLQWLENTNENIPKTGTSLRDKMKIFNKVSNRANEDGLNTAGVIGGKLAFIDSLKLPIHVKWQGIPSNKDSIPSPNAKFKHVARSKNDSVGAYPTFEWLASEIEKGEDVEIKFGWYDSLDVRHDGHWVVVTGVSDITTARGIYVKDDEYQEKAGGMRQTFLNWVTNEAGRPRLVNFKGKYNRCWVESVVSESYDSTITFGINNPKVKKIKVDEGPANWNDLKGLFEFSFPPSEEVRFLNVFASNPGSTDTSVWIIKNLALPPFDMEQELLAWFDFSWLEFQPGDLIPEINLGYSVDMDIMDYYSISFKEPFLMFPVTEENLNISLNFNNRPPIGPISFSNELSAFIPEPYKTWEYRGCTVPNIDLDSTMYNPTTVAGYAGDKNACGPASAANSMQWLENKYKEIDSETTHREKLKELSKLMSRTDNSTVTDENFVKGKLAFIDKYKLPIRVKMQGIFFGSDSIASPDNQYKHFAENKNDTANAYPNWDWLVSEMKDDEDVEIGIAWYDSLGNSLGGHWVTASGVSEVGSYRGLYVKDDGNQKIAGGTRQQFTNVDTINGGKPYLPQLSSENSICMLEAVVSESYDSTITFVTTNSQEIVLSNQLKLTVYENPSSRLDPVSIAFELAQPGDVQVYIFDITGRLVFSREFVYNSSGTKTVLWDGKENKGLLAGSGVYLVRVVNGDVSATAKFIRQD
jgi:hypothetical protein